MKYLASSFIFLCLFFLMLLFPSETLRGASNGLLLWFQILIPTLLPYLVITNILIQTHSMIYIVKFIGPFVQKLFKTTSNGSFAVLSGFLCGYPIGAKVTADLVKTEQISVEEGNYLLSICNQTSPAFITSYVFLQNFQDSSLLIPSLLILYASTFLCSFRYRRKIKHTIQPMIPSSFSKSNFSFFIFDDCIMNAFETLTKVGGYIILCSILFELGQRLPLTNFLPLLEITNGVSHILMHSNNFIYEYVYVMGLISFGGLCSVLQTASVILNSQLSIRSYIIKKLITALVTSLLSSLYVMIILR